MLFQLVNIIIWIVFNYVTAKRVEKWVKMMKLDEFYQIFYEIKILYWLGNQPIFHILINHFIRQMTTIHRVEWESNWRIIVYNTSWLLLTYISNHLDLMNSFATIVFNDLIFFSPSLLYHIKRACINGLHKKHCVIRIASEKNIGMGEIRYR